MPRSSRKKRAGSASPQGKEGKQSRAMPPPASIISVKEFTSPKSKKTYRVIETNEMDAYDKVEQSKGKRAGRAKKKRGE